MNCPFCGKELEDQRQWESDPFGDLDDDYWNLKQFHCWGCEFEAHEYCSEGIVDFEWKGKPITPKELERAVKLMSFE